MKIKQLTALLILGSYLSCTAQPITRQYEMFRGNIQHSGVYASTEVNKKPILKWRFKTGGYVNSSVAVEGGSVFFGSADGYLYCVDASKGSLAWKFKTGGPVHSSPAIVDGEVFFGSHDGNFYALDAKDGKLKWTFKTGGEKFFSAKGIHGLLPKDSLMTDLWDFWLSSPAVDDNTVYFGSGDGYFYALDKENGREKWKFESAGIIHSSPALAFGNVYFGGWDTYLHALNAVTGKEVWKFKTGEDSAIHNQTGITSSPMINSNMLYFGCRDSHLYALDAKNGKLVWTRYNDGGWVSVTPIISGNKLIYTSGSDKKLTALNKLNGDSIYCYDVATGMFSSPALTGNLFYYGGMNGLLYARDVKTGKLVWDFQLPTSSEDFYHILNPDHTINRDGYLAAIKKYKGSVTSMEIRLSPGAILSSPVIKNGVIYFGATDGYVYALQ